MPVYEYACKACGHEFEREQRISDKPVKKCPECGALKAKRLISRTSFVLKGGGWYNDLYATPKAKEGSDKGDVKETPADAKADKPAEKSVSSSDKKDRKSGTSSSKDGASKSKGAKGSKAA